MATLCTTVLITTRRTDDVQQRQVMVGRGDGQRGLLPLEFVVGKFYEWPEFNVGDSERSVAAVPSSQPMPAATTADSAAFLNDES